MEETNYGLYDIDSRLLYIWHIIKQFLVIGMLNIKLTYFTFCLMKLIWKYAKSSRYQQSAVDMQLVHICCNYNGVLCREDSDLYLWTLFSPTEHSLLKPSVKRQRSNLGGRCCMMDHPPPPPPPAKNRFRLGTHQVSRFRRLVCDG